ncbi:MAG: trypsin-like peptidase domain-containing protein [Anaerolineaceae bacterium]|nr:trypsin-like peptidase domain-containing protein [Anaerolineaceae bacterium]
MNKSPNSGSDLAAFSESLADSVALAGISTVLVNARHRIPASGIVFKPDLVLTADHVVEREEDIQVILQGGKELTATIAGRDSTRDLALLRLSESIAVPAAAASAPGRVGNIVLALGRPEPESVQVSLGVISSFGGPLHSRRGSLLEQYIRTDTIPFPGFSGGPLVNVRGEILGLNTSGLSMGYLLTIPVSLAWQAAEILSSQGHIPRAYLGVRSQVVEISAAQRQHLNRNQETALLLVSVEEDGPAAKSGLIVGDILVSINNQPVLDHEKLQEQIMKANVGSVVSVDLLRGGQLTSVAVTIGERS